MNPALRNVLILVVVLAVMLAAAFVIYPSLFREQATGNDPFLSLTQVNEYTQGNFGFSFENTSSAVSPIALVCNDGAPKNPTETDYDQFTYCQNDGSPLKVSIAWKDAGISFLSYLNRIANTVMGDNKENSGTFACVEDTSSRTKNSFPGRVSDCTITTTTGNAYYFSAFFFSPPAHPGISQVLYVYDSRRPSDENAVKDMVRSLAGTVTF